jgi:hypothetical protein
MEENFKLVFVIGVLCAEGDPGAIAIIFDLGVDSFQGVVA